jgi:hypothetical protein
MLRGMDRYSLYHGDKLLGWFECRTKVDEKVIAAGIGYLHLADGVESIDGMSQHALGPFPKIPQMITQEPSEPLDHEKMRKEASSHRGEGNVLAKSVSGAIELSDQPPPTVPPERRFYIVGPDGARMLPTMVQIQEQIFPAEGWSQVAAQTGVERPPFYMVFFAQHDLRRFAEELSKLPP